jgi:fibronectin type 3 domain-containing protein
MKIGKVLLVLLLCSSLTMGWPHKAKGKKLGASLPSVTLVCTGSTGATGYNAYRSAISGSGYVKLNATPASTCAYTDATVVAGATYYYVMTSVNTSVESAYSSQVAAVIPPAVTTALSVTTASLPAGKVGTPYTATLAATGGTPPYTWTDPACSGACNTGLQLSAVGILSGNPVNPGTSTFTFTVTDAAGNKASVQLTISIASVMVIPLPPTGLTVTITVQ